jgi:hypothetical protein
MAKVYGEDQVRMFGEKSLDVRQVNAAQFEGGLLSCGTFHIKA